MSGQLLPEWVKRRAGGRRRYNAVRKVRAQLRRIEVAKLLIDGKRQKEIAALLSVHSSTICRDRAALIVEGRRSVVCPVCGNPVGG